MLKKFKIVKLFGTVDVEIGIKPGANIFIGENGMGKTTILNLLYLFLTGDISKIRNIIFDKVTLYFSERQFTISRKAICNLAINCDNNFSYNRRRRGKANAPINDLLQISDYIKEESFRLPHDKRLPHDRTRYIYKNLAWNVDPNLVDYEMYELVEIYTRLNAEDKELLRKISDLRKELKLEILYFPTFRRIETDLKQLGFSDEDADKITSNKLLNFGMGDVENLLKIKLENIQKSIRIGFSKMTTTLLKQYLSDNIISNKSIDSKKINAIFSILSDSLPKELREKIFEMVEQKQIYDDKNKYLANYISCLVNIYEEQSDSIESVEEYTNTCNKYLYDKQLSFDKNNLQVNIIDSNAEEQKLLQFSDLSSGEKQIISIFSKLYLEDNKNYLVLFDEPELSLSIEWQRMLVPDIMKTKYCKQLLAVTHSPFIFDNEFDFSTRSLKDCMSR